MMIGWRWLVREGGEEVTVKIGAPSITQSAQVALTAERMCGVSRVTWRSQMACTVLARCLQVSIHLNTHLA